MSEHRKPTPGNRDPRKVIASLGASTMHERHPDAARHNGAKGGEATAGGYADGRSAWARRMALARWHNVPFRYVRSVASDVRSTQESRAPAGIGEDGCGIPESVPASACPEDDGN